ncbi:hypothetical protein ACIRP7_04915 [Streptomyces sp. NPDC102270]|uniref:hypothetical protein n=1 Tax=Streptomyces sp. NPDC102270 TaxID=3366150 RepID=UPI00381DDA61
MSGWSRSFLNPSLVSALEAGRSFEEWLGGRIPGVDYARISADQSTRSAVLATGREAGTGIRHQHEENIETADAFGVAIVRFYEDNGLTAAQPAVVRPAFVEVVDALHCRRTADGHPVQALCALPWTAEAPLAMSVTSTAISRRSFFPCWANSAATPMTGSRSGPVRRCCNALSDSANLPLSR